MRALTSPRPHHVPCFNTAKLTNKPTCLPLLPLLFHSPLCWLCHQNEAHQWRGSRENRATRLVSEKRFNARRGVQMPKPNTISLSSAGITERHHSSPSFLHTSLLSLLGYLRLPQALGTVTGAAFWSLKSRKTGDSKEGSRQRGR